MGTILPYIGTLEAIPHGWFLCDGSNGTPDLRDRFLEGSSSPKTFIEPGLPNITGYLFTYDSGHWLISKGVFQASFNPKHTAAWGTDEASYENTLTFDASRSSALYGNSDTVQPAAYTVYYIIRLK